MRLNMKTARHLAVIGFVEANTEYMYARGAAKLAADASPTGAGHSRRCRDYKRMVMNCYYGGDYQAVGNLMRLPAMRMASTIRTWLLNL